MANLAPVRNTIRLRSPYGLREEAPAGETILPGQLLRHTLGTVGTPGSPTMTMKKHNVVGGRCERMFAVEDALQGKTILGGYPTLPINPPGSTPGYLTGDIVAAWLFNPGDLVNARLQAGQTTTGGEYLASAGDGTLMVVSNTASVAYKNVAASAAVTNTTTPTAFDKSYTIPANTLQVGDVIRIRFQGIAPNTHSSDTLEYTLKIGSTTIVATGAVNVADGDIGIIEVILIIRTIGSGGTFVADGVVGLGAPGTVDAIPFILGSTTINTTVAQAITVVATWSAADVGDSTRLDILTVDIGCCPAIAVGVAIDAVNNAAGDASTNSSQTTDEFCAIRLV